MRWCLLFFSLAGAACAHPPTKEVQMAAARVEKAREAGAATYAPQLLGEAEKALNEAREALVDRRGNYRDAISAAVRACLRADEARGRALEEGERASWAVVRLLREDEALLEEARSKEPNGIGSDELDSLATRHTELERSFAAGELATTHERANELKEDLLRFLSKIETQRERP